MELYTIYYIVLLPLKSIINSFARKITKQCKIIYPGKTLARNTDKPIVNYKNLLQPYELVRFTSVVNKHSTLSPYQGTFNYLDLLLHYFMF